MQIRLRVEPDEVERFARDGRLEEKVEFGNGLAFAFALTNGPTVGAFLDGNRLTVTVDRAAAARWASGEEIGIENLQENGTDSGLNVLIEKDLGRRRPRLS